MHMYASSFLDSSFLPFQSFKSTNPANCTCREFKYHTSCIEVNFVIFHINICAAREVSSIFASVIYSQIITLTNKS